MKEVVIEHHHIVFQIMLSSFNSMYGKIEFMCSTTTPSWDFFTYFWKILGESNTYHFKKSFINKLFFQFIIIDVFLLLARQEMVKNHDKKNADREKIIIFPGRKEEKFQSELGKPNCLVQLSPIKVFCVYVKNLLFSFPPLAQKYVCIPCVYTKSWWCKMQKKVSIIFQKIFTFPSSFFCWVVGEKDPYL